MAPLAQTGLMAKPQRCQISVFAAGRAGFSCRKCGWGKHGGSGSALRHAWKLVRCTRRCCELPSQESPTGGMGQQAAETELSSVCTTCSRLSVVLQHRVICAADASSDFASESQCEQSPEANLSSIKVFVSFLMNPDQNGRFHFTTCPASLVRLSMCQAPKLASPLLAIATPRNPFTPSANPPSTLPLSPIFV